MKHGDGAARLALTVIAFLMGILLQTQCETSDRLDDLEQALTPVAEERR